MGEAILLLIGSSLLFCIIMYFIIKGATESNRRIKEREAIKNTKEYQDSINEYNKLIKKYKTSEYYYHRDDTVEDEYYYCNHYAIFDNKLHMIYELSDYDFVDIVQDKIEDLKEQVYDFDKIKYYRLEGAVYQQQHISGGGGGGSSIKGAVVGGLIGGDVGAIIGSRKKIDDIQTTYEEADDRRVIVTLKNDDEVRLPYQYYDRLLDYAPEKDYENYIASKKEKAKKK